jgi:hypothetical protein
MTKLDRDKSGGQFKSAEPHRSTGATVLMLGDREAAEKQAFDEQIAIDAVSGKLYQIAAEALSEHMAGKSRRLR